jgi:DNA mismatch repair protein MutL
MPDVIRLLSDHLANQIAAGEVIQRPASAVKELLENSVDAGATEIQLILKEAGKELIQVVDNGGGMSPTDARMAFERHATSKITNINDLFSIRTMGFRGEALASIAAVAQVEMKTRRESNEIGTRLVIEGTQVISQEACATAIGTSISVKNLFFNVPARRHFLKSHTTEYRHAFDEFTRVAMAFPEVAFRLFHNGTEQLRLERGTSKARIVGLLGNSYEKNLAPVEEETDFLTIRGFIGKPESATRTRGNQFFFVNGRFVRSPYLHHAVSSAYEGLIEKDAFPFYVLFLQIDPARVDVNVHPTKQEVKFEDDRLVYAYLQAAVKHALARYNMAPSLDFTLDAGVQALPAVALPQSQHTVEQTGRGYLASTFAKGGTAHLVERTDSLQQWKDLYTAAGERARGFEPLPVSTNGYAPVSAQQSPQELGGEEKMSNAASNVLSVQGSVLVSTVKSGLLLVHVRRAMERIWYERLVARYNNGTALSQRVLFPESLEFSPPDALLLTTALPELTRIGFDVVPFGQAAFAVQGTPSGMPAGEERRLMEEVVDAMRHEAPDAVGGRAERLLVRIAFRLSHSGSGVAVAEGRQALVDELFGCSAPEWTPGGKRVFKIVGRDELDAMLM